MKYKLKFIVLILIIFIFTCKTQTFAIDDFSTTYEELITTKSTEEMYGLFFDLMQNDPNSLLMLSVEEINNLRIYITELDAGRNTSETQELLEILEILPNGSTYESAYELLLYASTMNEMWQIMSAPENSETVAALKFDEINVLREKIGKLFYVGDKINPSEREYFLAIQRKLDYLQYEDDYIVTYANSNKTWTGSVAGDDVPAGDTWNVVLTGNTTLNGEVIVKGTLIIDTDGNGTHTIKRTNGSSIFRVDSGGTLIVRGTSAAPIVIQGYTGTDGSYGTITMLTGKLELNHVNIKGTRRNSGYGGAIQFGDAGTQTVTTTITNSSITDCRAKEGSAMMFLDNCGGTISISNSKITNCLANGTYCGTIRTQGNANCKLTVSSCEITENVSNKNGGGIYWNARGANASLTVTGTVNNPTIISNNEAQNGGGIFLSGSSISIQHTQITNNTATYGGGICMQPYDYGSTTTGKGCNLTLGAGAKLENNEATQYGGGIYMDIHSGSTTEHEDFTITIEKDSLIQGNSAPFGGAFTILQKLGGSENTVNQTKKYDAYVFIEGGEISNNTATSNGGAFYISREYGDAGAEFDLNIEISGGNIFNNKATNNGGAFYLADNASTSEAQVIVSGGTIYSNTAVNGGAVYVQGGNFIMTNGSLSNNVASVGGGAVYINRGNLTLHNGSFLENESNYGGAIYVNDGNFTMNGGKIEGNTATECGGGIQVSDGNVYITGGKVSSNIARGKSSDAGYGGGIFVDGGEIVSIKGGEISNNVAAKNGGGIEIKTAKTVTVDIYSGTFIDNVADENGGAVGIECDNGTINVGEEGCDGSSTSSHVHPKLSGNMAGIQGGGFYMTGAYAILNIYCGLVDNNIVVDIENNFDQSSGTVTIYEGVLVGNENEGIIVVGGTFIDKRTQDEEKFSVIYYSNYNESQDYREALITKGSVITLPGNIFNVDGYEVLGWTKDKNNTSVLEHEVGELIEITEPIALYAIWGLAEENEPTFMIIIPAEININSTRTVTFNMETQLNWFPREKMLKISLDEEDFKLNLMDEGNIIDSLDYKLTKNGDEIESGGVISEFYSNSTLITYNRKEQLEISVLESASVLKYAGNYEDMITFIVAIEDVN